MRTLLRFTALLAGAAVACLLVFLPFRSPSPAPAPAYDTPRDLPAVDDGERRSEKSRRMAGDAMGYPDYFAAYHAGIRTRPDGTTYPPNYRQEALWKARAAAKGRARRALPWRERGPGNVSGRTRALAVDPEDPTHRTWIAGSVGGGLWKTTDAGQTWQALGTDMPNLAISALVQAPSNPDVLYAGTGEGFFNVDAVSGAGIFKTTDRGQTWVQLPATATDPDFRWVNRLIIDPAREDVVLAATNEGIFRTEDGGITWATVYRRGQATGGSGGRLQQIVATPGNFAVQYATENGVGVLKSTDGGRTWALSSQGLPDGVGRIELAIAPSKPSRLYAALEGSTSMLFLSDDAGGQWRPVIEADPAGEPDWLGAQGWYDNALAVHPFSPDTLFVGGINLWKMSLAPGTRQMEDFTGLDEEGTTAFMSFVRFSSGTQFGGRLATGPDVGATGVSRADFVSVELRFGPGRSQRAHRFTVSPTAGTNGDGGAGIPFSQYRYGGYVEVPFEVWDITNGRQLMLSFRDQADNGVFDLIGNNTSGPRDTQSREYFFVHALPYTADAPAPQIAQNGGLTYRMLYFMWPFLQSGAAWNPEALPPATLRIRFESFEAHLRTSARTDLNGGPHVDHHVLQLIPIDAGTGAFMILNGNDGGVYYSEDGGRSWQHTRNGYNTTQFYGADKKPGADVYIGGMQDNGTWRSFNDPNAAAPWSFAVGGDGFDVVWHPVDGEKIVASYQFNGIVRTINGGLTWASATTGLGDTGASGGGQFITSIARTRADPDLLFTIGQRGVWRSTDFAASWQAATIETDKWGASGSGKVRISLADPNVVWAGYRMDATGRLQVSTDRGRTFSAVKNPAGVSGRFSGLATHPREPHTAYVLFSQFGLPKIYRTTDLGQTWEDLSGFEGSPGGQSTNGFPDVAVYDLLVLPHEPRVLWAGTEIGLFVSFDDGATWTFEDSFPAVSIWQMRVVDDEIVLATHGRGIWTVDLAAVPTGVEPVAGAVLPAAFTLGANYPNPFGPETTIPFALPRHATVRLAVYDLAGRRVATLADGDFPPGFHEVTWDARALASGVYLVRLEAGDFVQSRKLTLVR
ncbi:T9SS type A sorting domain-containing protein [Rhodocaloribacter litoris]|uniref:T9SS type A sorting domain-containing protein n=1 Tax=Rhodocaloribacter litoris TaxID=2558931 RepID=UPI001423B653|nr:T9SS type A sorting domain-containing protein [Rhodocaloribacter litoris]QXD16905.1 T9SS type A sorting domain-containing protein [Rhodocaloribacter litoris]